VSGTGVELAGPLFLFLAAALTAVACYFVQRWTLLAGLAAGASCLLLGWTCLQLADAPSLSLLGRVSVHDGPFALLGREWALTPSNSAILTFVFLACGTSFLAALLAPQGPAYYPFGMAVLAMLVLALTAEQYTLSVLFLWIAVVLSVFILAGGRPRATTGAMRFVALASMGVMLLLTVAGYVADARPGALHTARILAVLGFGLLLYLAPFHGQLVGIGAHTAPMVPAFMLATFPAVTFYILLSLGRAQPALFEDQLLFSIYRLLGAATVAVGGVGAAGQRRWGYLVGYAVLVDWGTGMIALGQGTVEGITSATQMLVWRTLSLLLVGTGLTIVMRTTEDDDFGACSGLLHVRLPGVLALSIGLLSLAGYPLTPGFVGRWPLISTLFRGQPITAWVVLLSGASVTLGTLVGVKSCLGPTSAQARGGRGAALVGMVVAALVLALVGTSVLRPLLWIELTERMLGTLSFPPM
jgi:formate hydrogenlyase subunit 3/multisubunit Na+/H+ antiporter MnhD subunit